MSKGHFILLMKRNIYRFSLLPSLHPTKRFKQLSINSLIELKMKNAAVCLTISTYLYKCRLL